MIEVAFQTVADGSFAGGIYDLGMKEGAVSIASYHELEAKVPDEVKAEIQKKVLSIAAGEFTVTCDTKIR